ncbi:MAG: hypothetical protein H0V74_09540 [Chloroflexi bacterium]|nr:hypothetical protein [Chloroflexota bacterium]
MDRLVALYRGVSSLGTVVALVLANLLPLAGVLWFGWDLRTILVVYWLENGIVGGYNVLKMVLAQGGEPSSPNAATMRVFSGGAAKVFLVPFFIVHYGLFWAVHGVFVWVIPVFFELGRRDGDVDPFGPGPSLGLLAWALLGLAISHGVAFYLDYIRRGEYRRASAATLMFAPYGRLIVLHMTIILGTVAAIAIGAPIAAVVVLVVLKIALDLGLLLRPRPRLRRTLGA